MSVVMDNGYVDGYALVSGLAEGVGLRVDQISEITVTPTEVRVEYMRLNEQGKKYVNADGEVARGRLTLGIDWSRK